ncbi:MAG: NUDIX domain-containing protein [Phycisphaerales bacterium]|nr:NUDIX domain-containing protein [Phycisphaerales bacterium]MCB9840518.1 NUDIX domain-containing protein [Phycisphaeraceae bacterium]
MGQHIEVIARALIEHQGRVLLCRSVEHGYAYLPGGHVEFGESAGQAVARELEEEAGVAARVGEPVLFHECRFVQRGKPRHELSVLFHVELEDSEAPVRSREAHIAFDWITLADLPRVDLRPAGIIDWLRQPSSSRASWLSTDER